MNSPLVDLKLDKSTFLRWAEGREGHFELKGGRIADMTGGTKGHARIIARIMAVLLRRLDLAVWSITTTDLAVEIGDDIRYPDIIVEPLDTANSALSTDAPVFIVEVLSPSSLALDLNIKAAEYMSLPSLEAYLVAAQDEMRMWLWQRPAGNCTQRPFPKHPEELAGSEAMLRLAALAVEVPLGEIYGGIVPPR